MLLCIKQLQSMSVKTLCTKVFRAIFNPIQNYHFNPILITDYRLQFIYEPIICGANLKTSKYVSKNIYYYIYNIYIIYK